MGSNPVQVTIRNKSLIQEKLESVFLFRCAYDHMFINKKSTFQDLFWVRLNMKEQHIEFEMAALTKSISYPSEDVGKLAATMRATPEGDDQFYLSGYETIGDAM